MRSVVHCADVGVTQNSSQSAGRDNPSLVNRHGHPFAVGLTFQMQVAAGCLCS